MRKFDVVIGLERLAEARRRWNDGRKEFDTGFDRALSRLVHEGTREFMSPREMANVLGWPVGRMRTFMQKHNLNPRDGKRVLSDQAAKALRENAALLGVKPHEMDLTSPLAYLPMGNDLRTQLQDQTTAQVKEFPETDAGLPDCEGWTCQSCGADNFIPAGYVKAQA
jgi:hypothetical protein